MYKKFLIVASKKDIAGTNITTQLSQFDNDAIEPKFKFYLPEEDMLHNENLDIEKINQYDFIIFASRHQSKQETKTLSIHTPGNWLNTKPLYGGESEKVCPASALFLKQIFKKLHENVKKFDLKNYEITMEATHHGPIINKPCLFIEIGSTENEWKDRRAGFVVAKTISDIIDSFKENPYNEPVIAIGGPHYCPAFNKLQLKSNLAISHVISNHAFPLTEQMVKEAISKTEEEIEFALLDWDGLGNAESREQVLKILDKLYIRYEKTSSFKLAK